MKNIYNYFLYALEFQNIIQLQFQDIDYNTIQSRLDIRRKDIVKINYINAF